MNHKSRVIQHASRDYRRFTTLSHGTHVDYACRHEIGFDVFHSEFNPSPFSLRSENKAAIGMILLERSNRGDFVAFLDADALIVKPEVDLRTGLPEGKDIAILGNASFVNSGVLLLRNTAAVRALFVQCFERGPVRENNNDFDLRLCERINAADSPVKGKVHFLDDKWNYFDTWQGQPRPVGCQKKDAIILHWAGMQKDEAFEQMKSEVAKLESLEFAGV